MICGKFGEGTAERKPVPAPKSKGQRLNDLFIQFSGHVYAVTGERLGNFVG
ncbi:hypothetical protein AE07_04115 [Enterobacter cloacae BWH 43]|nr:hypothetical protein AE07_04115 [Enterobacter cloacae BWH 43]